MLGSFSPFLSWHKYVEASASRLLYVMAFGGGKKKQKHQIGWISEAMFFISAAYLSQVDFELRPVTDNTSLHTLAAQRYSRKRRQAKGS